MERRLVMRIDEKLQNDIKNIAFMKGKTITSYVLDLVKDDLKKNEEKLKQYKKLQK